MPAQITVQDTIHASVEKVWDYYTNPIHITKWNNASEDWHTPHAETDLRVGGKFLSRMEAKDGSAGFDFSGVYTAVEEYRYIAYIMEDGRTAEIQFTKTDDGCEVTVTFDPENENSLEMQRAGWQAILDNFKTYLESAHD